MPPPSDSRIEVLVIGAGMSGMAAAADLARAGKQVLVVDKGRDIGGRMAARRIGEAVFDHGAQFITARSDRFCEITRDCGNQGTLQEWCRGFSPGAMGNPRWRGVPDMTALPKHLAREIEVCLEKRVESICCEQDSWLVTLEGGASITAGAIVLTPPIPQSLVLLDSGNFQMPPDLKSRLSAISYECCLAVLAVLGGPSGLSSPGGMAFEEGPVSWLADNQLKGISPIPCVTIHASPDFSQQHWDSNREEVAALLLRAVEPWVRSNVIDFQVHGWRYSKPTQVESEPCMVMNAHPPLVMAGDAFAGPKVEGAACSGWAAAAVLLDKLLPS